MRQILQHLKTGKIEIADVPAPTLRPGHVLIETKISLISSGTERMLVSFAKSGLIGKAQQQPDKVRQVWDKIRTDGLIPTLEAVSSRLDQPLPLGYCNCGVVIDVADDVAEFQPGDRVVSNGAHAEIVCVAKNLCAKIPENVKDEQAVFTILASIGLQGIRLLRPTLGETMVVFGLGLIGLLSLQLLRACGCKVIGIDIDKEKLSLARQYGEAIHAGEDCVKQVMALTKDKGVDGVLITASAKEDSILQYSGQMSRKRGRIILIGVVDLNINRADFYEKELSFQVSCSYGPGRYDRQYEEKGQDYPFGLVRWTEQRNFVAVLDSLSSGIINIKNLIGKRFSIENAEKAYEELLSHNVKTALVLTYPECSHISTPIIFSANQNIRKEKQVCVGVIGAGNFSLRVLLPALKKLPVKLQTIAPGAAGAYAARKFGFSHCTGDYRDILKDPEINTVFIVTRHDSHARIVTESLKAGKHVMVEKPLCLNAQELSEIQKVYAQSSQILMVGFNRRFSPHALKMQSLLKNRRSPICLSITINAGAVPADSWVQDKKIGGGRMIGEGCHWIDLMLFLVGSPIIAVKSTMIGKETIRDDKITVTFEFADGSIGTLHYFANGHRSFPKETCQIFCEGKILELNNFRKLRGYGWPNFSRMNLWVQDKGHRKQWQHFIKSISTGTTPIPFNDIIQVTKASFATINQKGNDTANNYL